MIKILAVKIVQSVQSDAWYSDAVSFNPMCRWCRQCGIPHRLHHLHAYMSFEMEENILRGCVCHSMLLPDSVNNCWVHDMTVHS